MQKEKVLRGAIGYGRSSIQFVTCP